MLRGVAKQMMYASLLSQIRQGHEEAGFTHPYAITLTVMSRAVSPVRLQHTELFAVPRHSHGGTTDVARHIGVSVVWYVHARQYLSTHQKIFNTVVSSALLRAPGPASTYRVLRVLKMHPSANSISCVVRTQSPSWKRLALSYRSSHAQHRKAPRHATQPLNHARTLLLTTSRYQALPHPGRITNEIFSLNRPYRLSI